MPDPRLAPLVLSDDERRTLEKLVQAQEHRAGLALRARIALASAGGGSNTAVAAWLGVTRSTVTIWRARFLARRLDGLHDERRKLACKAAPCRHRALLRTARSVRLADECWVCRSRNQAVRGARLG